MKKIVYAFAVLLFLITACGNDDEASILVSGISLNEQNLSLEIGGTTNLEVYITPDEATNKTVYWSSSANGVATVTDAGLVTAVSKGLAIIKARTEDGDFEAYCNVSVVSEAIQVTSIALDITNDTLDINCTVLLTATVTPENATNKTGISLLTF